jgi:very-short-patch-repair endonuclease
MADLFLMRWAKLYSQPTPAERALEPAIAKLGLPYRFQHPIWALRVFPDFVILPLKLVIEVDDPSHSTKRKREADADRTKRLQRAGWRVVRCTNAEALADPTATVSRLLSAAGVTLQEK